LPKRDNFGIRAVALLTNSVVPEPENSSLCLKELATFSYRKALNAVMPVKECGVRRSKSVWTYCMYNCILFLMHAGHLVELYLVKKKG
jgi:hypothetical protein